MIIGICFALGIGIIYSQYMRLFPFWEALIIIVFTLTGAIAGDLIFSNYKRHYNVKDFLPVLNQHGGIIDIYDSFIFANILFYISQGIIHMWRAAQFEFIWQAY